MRHLCLPRGGGIFNCPTRQSTCYCSLGLSIDCLVGSGDILFGGLDCIGNHAGKKWPIWVVNYFANFKNHMSQDVEFRCYHLVFGVFCHQIHVKKSWISEIDGHLWCVAIFFGNSWTWWEHCVLREQDGSLQISENDGYIVAIIFGNSSLYMAIIFRNSWIRRKMDLFCSLKSVFGWYFIVFQSGIYIGRLDLPKTSLDFVNLGPQRTVCNLHPHIWSHHPVLDSHVQITRKYSTAMCSMCSCSDQRSQNKLLWSMKGIESLRI